MLLHMDMMQCQNLAVPADVMHHVVQVESSANPYAIGVVGGKLVRQPQSLAEAVSTARMLEDRGYNFSVGLAQVNRYNLDKYGINSYEQAFDGCTNVRVGSKILSECQVRAKGDWGSAFSCYYSGNFTTGFEHGYVQKIYSSMASGRASSSPAVAAIPLMSRSLPSGGAAAVGQGNRKRGEDNGGDVFASTASVPGNRLKHEVSSLRPDPALQIVGSNVPPAGTSGAVVSGKVQGGNDLAAGSEAKDSDDNAFVF